MGRRHEYGSPAVGEYSERAPEELQPTARIGVRSVTCAKAGAGAR